MRSRDKLPKPGDTVVLIGLSPGFLDDLPDEDKKAVSEIIGKPVRLNEYEEDGRAELEFKDGDGNLHFVYITPNFVRPAQ